MKDVCGYIAVSLLAVIVTLMVFISAKVDNVAQEQVKAGKTIASMASDICWLKIATARQSVAMGD